MVRLPSLSTRYRHQRPLLGNGSRVVDAVFSVAAIRFRTSPVDTICCVVRVV
jgi:hypothetical protein